MASPMKVILFGATGMVGQGVLRECLLATDVDAVLTVGRSATGQRNPKLRELVHANLADLSAIEGELAGYDACFFCLGVSSAGLDEAAYSRVTYDIALAAGQVLSRLNPSMTFIYVSGAGTDSTGRGRAMWARVKGRTENALLSLPFRAYMFRPGLIQPMHGIRSRTRWYRLLYAAFRPLFGVARRLFPRSVSTTEQVGRAMLEVARKGAPRRILEVADITAF
jgi:uncharacterized protein YbjT (DUF2867 family)